MAKNILICNRCKKQFHLLKEEVEMMNLTGKIPEYCPDCIPVSLMGMK